MKGVEHQYDGNEAKHQSASATVSATGDQTSVVSQFHNGVERLDCTIK